MTTRARADRVLMYAAVLFAIGSAVHNADHIRRGQGSVTVQLLVAGYAAMFLTGITIILVLERHRLAPQIAIAGGFGLAVAFAASHWLPTWSVLSDSFVDGDVTSFSRAASLMEIAGGIALGFVGLYAIGRAPQGTTTAEPAPEVALR